MTPKSGQAEGARGRPTWSTPSQAAVLVIRGTTARTAGPIAAIVGTVLSLVNEGQILANGQAGIGVWIRIGVNYAIPFVVASVGYLAPLRDRGSDPAETPAGSVAVGFPEASMERSEPPSGPVA